jgi:hypothetical protein
MWYRQGTVTVTNGSNVVTGAGTDFVSNASVGEAFIGPDGRSYEIAQIVSATDLRLVSAYQAATGGGQTYAIQPTQSFARDLALAAAALLNTFAAVRDGAGQGLFGDGSAAAPGMRFSADQDTGVRRYAENAVALVGGGVDRVVMDGSGRVGIGGAPGYFFDVLSPSGPYVARMINTNAGSDQYAVVLFGQAEGGAATGYVGTGGSQVPNLGFRGNFVVGTQNAKPLVLATADREKARIDADGNLLVGITSAPEHTITKSAGQGSAVLRVRSNAGGALDSFVVASVSAYSPNGTGAAVYLGHSTATNRSLNASGTINGSGADSAEYMIKAAGCGIIAKGDVCGVDRDGKLTKTWADAISFVVKSTDPHLVGGDTWAKTKKPDAPAASAPVEPSMPTPPTATLPVAPARQDGESDNAFAQRLAEYIVAAADYQRASAAYDSALSAYHVAADAYPTAKAAYDSEMTRYEEALAAWKVIHEAERATVDRIAFSGQVPCNATGDFEVGDYIVAAQDGAGIKAIAMKLDDMTLAQYACRLGKVWAIRDGRPWIDVQHG